jgi:hypothetical protein
LIKKMKKPDHWSSCNQLQSGPVLVFFLVAQPDLETLLASAAAAVVITVLIGMSKREWE